MSTTQRCVQFVIANACADRLPRTSAEYVTGGGGVRVSQPPPPILQGMETAGQTGTDGGSALSAPQRSHVSTNWD